MQNPCSAWHSAAQANTHRVHKAPLQTYQFPNYLESIMHRGNLLLKHQKWLPLSLCSPRLSQRKEAMNTGSFFCPSIHFPSVFRSSFCCIEEAGDSHHMTSAFSTNSPKCKRSHLLTGNGEIAFLCSKDYTQAALQDSKNFHYTCYLRCPHLLPQHGKLPWINQQNQVP